MQTHTRQADRDVIYFRKPKIKIVRKMNRVTVTIGHNIINIYHGVYPAFDNKEARAAQVSLSPFHSMKM